MIQLPSLSLYVHIPWCVRKCPYCDFNSHQAREGVPEQAYLEALLRDMDQEIDRLIQSHTLRPLTSIFFGGGTPSLMDPKAIAGVIDHARQHIGFSDDIEITLEANPGTVDSGKFTGLREAGVNRLSIGIQSFQPQHLHTLGRIHSSTEASEAIHKARQAGFDNLNLDLMFGLPNQTTEQALEDIHTAINLNPEHISWYQLTIEPNTEFYRHPPKLPEDDALWSMHQRGIETLMSAGYEQYEVSAYARPDRQARHNLNYWQFGDYIAVGAGAHGKSTHLEERSIRRYWKTRLPQHYLARLDHYRAGEEFIAEEDLPFEFLMNALRLKQGVDPALFEQRTGLPLECISSSLSELRERGLIHQSRLQCTEQGYLYLNEVLQHFM
ncbi:YggW family oxidoreductase [Hahella sp. CCB-MM4]|uniref:radical SAM family heme chaperone HemW n=1 Tax=Hahella sp. (strain CCB-MM4) TaxID=1926491 RepID=UPI000B9A4050|nr:radical SAM family heme chaperone HemW [Hahella sp. CCB-MM4]OZG74268.1 YggW family oxidoreductase [Hahella sp. CCB-MM4]